MYIHISDKGYGANISNLVMYDAVSQDIMSRWTFPFVPELFEYHQHLGSGNKYISAANNVYKADNVEVGRNCRFSKNVIVGQGTKIGENAIIRDSVIGKNCTIGKNVRLVQCHLWDGVSVGDFCNFEICILADRVKIGDRVFLNFGCVLGPEVVIDNSVVLPTLTRLQAEEVSENDSFGEDDFEESTKSNKSVDKSLVGTNGHGYVCNIWEEKNDEREDLSKVSDIWGKPRDEWSEFRQLFSDQESSRYESLSVGEGASGESEAEGGDYEDDDISLKRAPSTLGYVLEKPKPVSTLGVDCIVLGSISVYQRSKARVTNLWASCGPP
ncbi:translation initiation factor eIF-2B subunit epsilon [Trichonephila clavipes]|nr:translation initiation factor eIF-2B subunit epsilon [Trichonephila clavipes]